MRILLMVASVFLFASIGCGGTVDPETDKSANTSDAANSDSSPTDSNASDTPPMPGSDRDAHGCIGSAGYQWCAKESKCVRPWELAMEKAFPNTAEDFARYCAG